MSSIEKLKSEYDNASSVDNTKTNEKSAGNTSKKGKPSPTTAEKLKSQKSVKTKKPKHELTDSEYEQFLEYKNTKNAEKTKKQDNFKMEVTPNEISIDPNAPLKITVKCMAGCSQGVIVEVDSFLFEIVNYKDRKGQKSQIYKWMEHEETLKFKIGLRSEKDAPVPNYDSENSKGYLTVCCQPYKYFAHRQGTCPRRNSYLKSIQIVRPKDGVIRCLSRLPEGAELQKLPIQLTKETDQVKRMTALYNEKIAAIDKTKEVEKKKALNNFQMDVNPKKFRSIDPDVPFKVSVKSLAKEKQKLIVEVDSFYLKVMNQMSQEKCETQIYCTIMPQETLNFEIGLKSEEEARKSKEGRQYFHDEGRLIIYNIKFEAEDEKMPHWSPYKSKIPQNSIFVEAENETHDREHGYAAWRIEMMSKETEATKMLERVRYEQKEDNKEKKKKCVIQ